MQSFILISLPSEPSLFSILVLKYSVNEDIINLPSRLNQTQISMSSFPLRSFYSLILQMRGLVPLEGLMIFFQMQVILKKVMLTLLADFTAVN